MWKGLSRKIIWLDEVNFTKLALQKREWSNKLTNINVDQATVYRGYVSVCAAITEDTGIEALAIQRKAFNAKEYIQFLYWLRFINDNNPLAIFLDNLQVHKTNATMEAYRHLNILPIFNLPYSPEYNPIESVFA